MTHRLLTTSVPVEQVSVGDQVIVSRTIGARPVLRIERYAPDDIDSRERFVIVYEPTGPGVAWENRGATRYRRDEAALAVKERGAPVEIVARGEACAQLPFDMPDAGLDGLSFDEWFRSLPRAPGGVSAQPREERQ